MRVSWPAPISLPWILLMVFITTTSAVKAEVRLSRVFGDNMVLQQRSQATLWGWAGPGEQVTVSFAGKVSTAIAGKDGKWKLAIKTPTAGGPYELQVAGDNTIVLKNVLVGEVWLAAGQSNMEFTLRQHADAPQEIAAAECPQVRMLTVRNPRSATPLDDVNGQWLTCTPEHAGEFSAVAYFFARRVQKELGVPVGIVSLAVGGTSIQSWMGREWVSKVAWSKQRMDEWDALLARPIGYRLAALALNKTYGRREIVCSGPWYQSMKVEGSKIRIRFKKEVDGGLVVKGDKVEGFAIAGADRQWVWAEAKLDGTSVMVWNDQVPKPVAVRYAWTDFPTVNLHNQASFPAAPFRTDDWPTEQSPEP